MSAMLGNYFYWQDRFDAAIPEYEAALRHDSGNPGVWKRLVVCYLYLGQLERALPLYLSVLDHPPLECPSENDSAGICPCQKLLSRMERDCPPESRGPHCWLVLGMLWSFFDLPQSIACFERARLDHPERTVLERVLTRLHQLDDNAHASPREADTPTTP